MIESKVRKIHRMLAELIIAGRMAFADIAKRLKAGVAAALREKGREDLATDSNARPRDESEED
mgnify:CR=1 FL=1